MKKIYTYLFVFASIFFLNVGFASAYVNEGYWYTDYNAGRVNYYKHSTIHRNSPAYTYPVYYPQYYPVYYPQYYTPCYDTYTVGPYYESSNHSPQCSDRLEDWSNRANLPNQFLSEMYGTTYY